MQESQPLSHNFGDEKVDAGCIAAWPSKAVDQAKLDWIFANAENDRDRRGRSFGRKRSRVAGGGSNNRHATTDQVGIERRQAIVLTIQPMVLDHQVLTFDVPGLVQALAERSGV